MQHGRRAIMGSAIAALALTFGQGAVQAQSQKPPIKLGLITPLTGPLASYGKAQELVVKLAVEDVNAKGGINGSPLQLDVQDSSTDPGQAVLLFRKFAGEGYFGVLGPMTGTQWETVSPLANRIQMPAISVNAIKPGITIRPWTIRLQPADDTLMPEGRRCRGAHRVDQINMVQAHAAQRGVELGDAVFPRPMLPPELVGHDDVVTSPAGRSEQVPEHHF